MVETGVRFSLPAHTNAMRQAFLEIFYFVYKNAWASAFGAFLLLMLLVTEYVSIPFLHRYDALFLAALGYQIIALVFHKETLKEFFVICTFHVLATIMELFKTHPTIASWEYPEVSSAFFAIYSVPLFTGFLYSAVGSYITRAMYLLDLRFESMPAPVHLWAIAFLVYVNFFTHHFIFDIRIALFAYLCIIFYKTRVYFCVYKRIWWMPFLLAASFTAFFVWFAENVGTLTNTWLYPHQHLVWHVVSFGKLGSWFLLLVLSFALVSLVHQNRLH